MLEVDLDVDVPKKNEPINWETFNLGSCQRCGLCKTRTQVVMPQIIIGSEIMFVGEAPGCFLAGTPIMTNEGVFNIEELIKGKQSLSGDEIINDLSYDVEDHPIIDFSVRGFPVFSCTENHEILVARRPLGYCKTKIPNKFSEFSYVAIKDINLSSGHDYYVRIPKRYDFDIDENIKIVFEKSSNYSRPTDKKLSDSLILDDDLGFLLGVYMGDGSANFNSGGVSFNLSIGYKEKYINRIQRIIKNYFNLECSIYTENKKVQVEVFSRTLVEWFHKFFGKNVYEKEVPRFLLKANSSILNNFLFGWYITDGSHNRKGSKSEDITSISKASIWNAFYMGLRCGVLLFSRDEAASNSTDERDRSNEKPLYSVHFDKSATDILGWTDIKHIKKASPHYGQDNDFYYVKLNYIGNRRGYSGKVYDKTTENHCYQIPFVVHNSDEDSCGIPFVGQSGQLLDKIMQEVGIDRFKCSVINTVQCRPPNNRTPAKEEIKACYDIVEHYIELVKPKIIVPLGNVALNRIAKTSGILKKNGLLLTHPNYPDVKIVPVVHPAFALRDPKNITLLRQGLLRVKSLIGGTFKECKTQVQVIDNYEKFDIMLKDLVSRAYYAIDIETSELNNWIDGHIICISFSCEKGKSYVLPWITGDNEFYEFCRKNCISNKKREIIPDVNKFCEQFGLNKPKFYWGGTDVKERLKELLANPKNIKILHNYCFDYKWLEAADLKIAGTIYDTMIMHFVLDESRGTHSLDKCTLHYLPEYGEYWKGVDHYIIRTEKKCDTYCIIPLEDILPYAGTDTDVTFQLFEMFYKMIYTEDEGFMPLLNGFLMPLSRLLLQTSKNGFTVDLNKVNEFEVKLNARITELDTKLNTHTNINFNSTKQLREYLFKTLALPSIKLTKKDAQSTDEEVLTVLANMHEVPKLLLERRKLMKVLGTYIVGIRDVVWKDGTVHPNFMLTGTETGRLSCNSPNIQNLIRNPVPGDLLYELGVRVRDIFICSNDDSYLVETDYSQAELRLIAEYSQDRNLYNAFMQGRDPHAELAVRLYHRDRVQEMEQGLVRAEDVVTKEERQKAKTANFALAYGKGPDNFALENGLSLDESRYIHRIYWETYTGILAWKQHILQEAYEKGYFKSYFNRKRRAGKLKSSDKKVRAEGEREGINFVIQSQASDYTLYSTMKVMEECTNLRVKTVSFVHDSAVYEVHKQDIQVFLTILRRIMIKPIGVSIPMECEVKVGNRLGSLKEWVKGDNDLWMEKVKK